MKEETQARATLVGLNVWLTAKRGGLATRDPDPTVGMVVADTETWIDIETAPGLIERTPWILVTSCRTR